MRRGFVDNVYCLIWKIPVRNVPVGQIDGSVDGFIGNGNAMMIFKLSAQTAQNHLCRVG